MLNPPQILWRQPKAYSQRIWRIWVYQRLPSLSPTMKQPVWWTHQPFIRLWALFTSLHPLKQEKEIQRKLPYSALTVFLCLQTYESDCSYSSEDMEQFHTEVKQLQTQMKQLKVSTMSCVSSSPIPGVELILALLTWQRRVKLQQQETKPKKTSESLFYLIDFFFWEQDKVVFLAFLVK